MGGTLRLRTLGAASVGALCLLAGCGGGSPRATTTSAPPPTTAGPTTSTTSAATPPQPCTTTQLAVSIGASTGVPGGRLAPVVVRNAAGTACTIGGYFGLALVNARGQPLGTSPAQTPGLVGPGRTAVSLTLAGATSAQFLFEWPGDGAPGQTCPMASSVELTAPGQTDHVTIAAKTADGTAIALCAAQSEIGPVTAGG